MLDLDYSLSVLNSCSHNKALTKMTPNLSQVVYELEREIALLPVEYKLWLQAQSDEEWTNQEWTQLSLQGLSRAYGDDEPDYEILET
jgi:hypothetical protein